ncbi:MAG: metalloregulator ArsR/SmtB family transcription factor [Acidobacteria bacterium]|nr:metalloregulator ArsR/SmtB family transcription factor [Acidobacteriota bacterium]
MEQLSRSLRVLADPTRLRILRLLKAEALSVGEITTILGAAQSTVSKQLGALRRAGLVAEERDGTFAFYHLVSNGDPIWPTVAGELARIKDDQGDLARLAEVIRRRIERGARPGGILEPGRSWPAWARALGHLLPPLRVADLGCGDGALTAEIARWARSVVAVDRDPARLSSARKRLRREGRRHVRFLCEDFTKLSLPTASVDLAILSQALHHTGDLLAALRQASRILVTGGRLLLLDLAPHREDWVRDKLGHIHLGFKPEDLRACLRRTGFIQIGCEDLPRGPGDPFRILVVTALKGKGKRVP